MDRKGTGESRRIKHNRVQCLLCENIIESLHVHDFVWCTCQSIFTDGGHEYIRRGGKLSYMRDLTEYED